MLQAGWRHGGSTQRTGRAPWEDPMSYEAFKVLHILGILVLFASLGGVAGVRMMSASGGSTGPRLFRVLHGVALAIVLLAGFGTLTKLGFASPGTWPLWVWIK